jgi:hypothetical protein
MEKETLEEAAERLAYDSTEENKGFPSMKRFIEGAKWMQERMYSQEEVNIMPLHESFQNLPGWGDGQVQGDLQISVIV